MKVRELKEELKDCDDEAEVFILLDNLFHRRHVEVSGAYVDNSCIDAPFIIIPEIELEEY